MPYAMVSEKATWGIHTSAIYRFLIHARWSFFVSHSPIEYSFRFTRVTQSRCLIYTFHFETSHFFRVVKIPILVLDYLHNKDPFKCTCTIPSWSQQEVNMKIWDQTSLYVCKACFHCATALQIRNKRWVYKTWKKRFNGLWLFSITGKFTCWKVAKTSAKE